MSSIITAVFKATIGLLVNKSRDKVAEKLRDGDVTDQKFSSMIVREMDDMKFKLEGLSRKDLLASISFFKEGVEKLCDVFRKVGPVAEADSEPLALARRGEEGLSDLDDSGMRMLADAKKRFEQSRVKATEAFQNQGLGVLDRILAIKYRIMATILEIIDHYSEAFSACKVCMSELHSMPEVQKNFEVQVKKSLMSRFRKGDRSEIICSVYQINSAMFEVFHCRSIFEDWIWVKIGSRERDAIDPLRDYRVTRVLRDADQECDCSNILTEETNGEWIISKNGKLLRQLHPLHYIQGVYDRVVMIRHILFTTTPETNILYMIVYGSCTPILRDELNTVWARDAMPAFFKLDLNCAENEIVKTAIPLHFLNPEIPVLHSMAVTSDGYIVTCSWDKMYVFDDNGALKCSFENHRITPNADAKILSVMPNGKDIVVDDKQGICVLTPLGRHLKTIHLPSANLHVAPHFQNGHFIVAPKDPEDGIMQVLVYGQDGKMVHNISLRLPSIFSRATNLQVTPHFQSGYFIITAKDPKKGVIPVLVYGKDGKMVRSVHCLGRDSSVPGAITVTPSGDIAITEIITC